VTRRVPFARDAGAHDIRTDGDPGTAPLCVRGGRRALPRRVRGAAPARRYS